MKQLLFEKTGNAETPFIPPLPSFSDDVYSIVLTANVAKDLTVPSAAKFVLFEATMPFFAKVGAAASIPSTDAAGNGSALNPSAWSVTPGDVVSLISPETCIITAVFYARDLSTKA
jgi:hypothetical protein